MTKDWLKDCTFATNVQEEELTVESLAKQKKVLEDIKFNHCFALEYALLERADLICKHLEKKTK